MMINVVRTSNTYLDNNNSSFLSEFVTDNFFLFDFLPCDLECVCSFVVKINSVITICNGNR